MENNIRMALMEVGGELDHLAEDIFQWQALVNMKINL
jgi:hypothetical protein